MSYQKEKLTFSFTKKENIPRNKLNQGVKRLVY